MRLATPCSGPSFVLALPCRHQHARCPKLPTLPVRTNALHHRTYHGRCLGGEAFEDLNFLDTNSAAMTGMALCPFVFWDYGTSSLPVTRRQMGYGVHGGSFELPKTRCLGSLNCTLRYFNTIVLNCKDVLSFSSCTKPSSTMYSTPLCVWCFGTCNTRQLYRTVVLELSCYRENGQGKIPRKRSRLWNALPILGVSVLLGAVITGVESKGIMEKQEWNHHSK